MHLAPPTRPTNKSTRVPLRLRGLVSQAAKLPILKQSAHGFYRIAAECCASTLAALPGVENVFLRGKEIRSSDPGISDLDFWVFLPERQLGNTDTLMLIRTSFNKLSRRFKLPCKLELTSSEAWELYCEHAPANLLRDLPLREYVDGDWQKIDCSVGKTIRPLSRFNACMFEYAQAFTHLLHAFHGPNSYFHSTLCRKHLYKTQSLIAEDARVEALEKGNIVDSLTKTFLRLHDLAKRSVATPLLAGNSNLSLLRDYDFSLCEIVEPTYALVKDIFRAYIADSATDDSAATSLPAIVSLSMVRCLERGKVLGPLLENLPILLAQRDFDLDELDCFSADVLLNCRDRLLTRLNHNVGVVVSYGPETFLNPLLFQCLESLVVCTRRVTSDIESLCEQAKSQMPLTTHWMKRLLEQQLPSDIVEWMEAFIQVRSESSAMLQRASNVEDWAQHVAAVL